MYFAEKIPHNKYVSISVKADVFKVYSVLRLLSRCFFVQIKQKNGKRRRKYEI